MIFQDGSFLFVGCGPAERLWSACGTVCTDNGNTLSVQGGGFCSRLFHPPMRRRSESQSGSWKWPCHMGNYSTLRSERTHKRPHYLQQHCWPACREPVRCNSPLTLRNTFILTQSYDPPEPQLHHHISFFKKSLHINPTLKNLTDIFLMLLNPSPKISATTAADFFFFFFYQQCALK